MSTSIFVAAAYLILTFQSSGLSQDIVKVIPYSTMKECEAALKSAQDLKDARCIPGSTDWHEPSANKP